MSKFSAIIIYLLIVLPLFFSCAKNKEYIVDLPEANSLGTTALFLNGEPSKLNIFIAKHRAVYGIMAYGFIQNTPDEGSISLSFDRGALVPGRYKLTEDSEASIEDANLIYTSMSQIVGEDSPGQEFKYIPSDDDFFEITELDFENEIAAGRFKVQFKRTRTRGPFTQNTRMPKWMTFEGVFRQRFE